MKIFEKDGRIHLQLMHMPTNRILFNFSVEKSEFPELKEHMIKSLYDFKTSKECPKCHGRCEIMVREKLIDSDGSEDIGATPHVEVCPRCNGEGVI